ncbi:TPA: hypothetical protein DDW35_05680 [Candidatus Sumerlaeota bacterium]|jgi:hypothetical protein|nr:hypothetical protein [Candidatus Sumerlaeota bacterium]
MNDNKTPFFAELIARLPETSETNCTVDEVLLWDLTDGALDVHAEEEIMQHVVTCHSCNQKVQAILFAQKNAASFPPLTTDQFLQQVAARQAATASVPLLNAVQEGVKLTIQIGKSILNLLEIGFDTFVPLAESVPMRGSSGSQWETFEARIDDLKLEIHFEQKQVPTVQAQLICQVAGPSIPKKWETSELEIYAVLQDFGPDPVLIESAPLSKLPLRMALPPGSGKMQLLCYPQEPRTLMTWNFVA